MKNLYILMALLCPLFMTAQHAVFNEIQEDITEKGVQFTRLDLFSEFSEFNHEALSQGKIGVTDNNALRYINTFKPDFLQINLPTSTGENITVRLKRHHIFSEDFQLTDAATSLTIPYDEGVHYKGYVNDERQSIAAFSFFREEIMGLSSIGNMNLVVAKQAEGQNHIIYNDYDLKIKNPFECVTEDDDKIYTKEELIEQTPTNKSEGDCIRVYIEVDTDVVQDKGSVAAATNYTTGLFNQSITLYSNEQVNMSVSEIKAWTVTSPYSSTTAAGMLSDFKQNISSINGNIGHLISYKASGGIAAGFSGLCNSNVDNSLCFSNIQSTYEEVPTYSWSTMVITHEMGHLIGSRHTHACVWNGNATAIDGCAGSTEGSCSNPGYPSGGGTIMSYCHLQSVGINLSLGFGSQPGNVIRNSINSATCTTPCGGATCSDGIQNGDETGVDCGGSNCEPCATCSDGVQNGDETGVDCGGSNCSPCQADYCASKGNNTNYEFIQAVTIGELSHNSGNGGAGYNDFTSMTLNAEPGASLAVTLNPGYSGSAYTEYWRIFIDYNDDSDFEDEGEIAFEASSNSNVSGTITIPENISNVNAVIRVAMKFGSYASPCETFSYGEVEDYSIQITGEEQQDEPTCSDGVQNGDETGVDCGGSNCEPCATCSDGVQNGDETGVDCGGANCEPCATCSDGVQNGDETGVDCGGSNCEPCATCSDGVQNGDETGVDCGGSNCEPCATCSDGVQNGDETGVDCGGSNCEPCATCSDGVQNGDETGVDCGGSNCAPCATCTDGVQNGNETGVDCGGPDCNPCNLNYCDSKGNSSYYEYIKKVAVGTINNESGNNSGYKDYTNLSTDMSIGTGYTMTLTPGFKSYSYTENWTVWIDLNQDGDFTDEGEKVLSGSGRGVVTGTISLPSSTSPGSTRMRVSMKYGGYSTSCQTFPYGEVEDYTVNVLPGLPSQIVKGQGTLKEINPTDDIDRHVIAYPVPTQSELNIDFRTMGETNIVQIVDVMGKVYQSHNVPTDRNMQSYKINTSDLVDGVYYVVLVQNGIKRTARFVVLGN